MPDRATAAELRRRLEELDRLEARAGGTYPIIDEERRRLERQLAEAEETSMGEQSEARTNGPGYSRQTFRKPNGSAPNGPDPAPVVPFDLEGPADFLRLKRPRFIVPGLLPEGEPFLLYSPSGAGKTTLMLLVLLLAANGRALDGSEIAPVPLIVVANEDAHGVKLRLRGLAEKLGLALDNVRVLGTGEFRLDLEEHRDRLVASAQHSFPGQRPMLMLDHYDVGVTEKPSDPETGAKARDGLRDLLKRAFATVVLLAHTPWSTSDRAKLPVALWANMGARAGLTKRDDGTVELHLEHVKNGPSGYTLTAKLTTVTVQLEDGPAETVVAELETDAHGAPVRGSKRRDKGKRQLTDDQATAIKGIARAIAERPEPTPLNPAIPRDVAGTREREAIATIASLVSRCTRTGRERKDYQQREYAGRLLSALHKEYLVRRVDGFVWLDRRAEDVE